MAAEGCLTDFVLSKAARKISNASHRRSASKAMAKEKKEDSITGSQAYVLFLR